MSWKDLLQQEDEIVVLPWVGGMALRFGDRTWQLEGRPDGFGWYEFSVSGRRARVRSPADPRPDVLTGIVRGYLVGDRLISENVSANSTLPTLLSSAPKIYLIESGLDRFVRISAGRIAVSGPMVFRSLEMPFGPEDAVLSAYLDKEESVAKIANVSPALDVAFKIETWRRSESERIRREEEERRCREEQRRKIVERLGDSVGRRDVARTNFGEAARNALIVGGAEYLDHRLARPYEAIVRFRVDRRRYECVCNTRTFRIIDAGICLTSEETGVKGDDRFTLESLPSVIREADRLGRLVVFRHVN